MMSLTLERMHGAGRFGILPICGFEITMTMVLIINNLSLGKTTGFTCGSEIRLEPVSVHISLLRFIQRDMLEPNLSTHRIFYLALPQKQNLTWNLGKFGLLRHVGQGN